MSPTTFVNTLVVLALLGLAMAAPGEARPEAGDAPAPVVAEPSYISILWGRSNWAAATGAACSTNPPQARTLEQNAVDLAERGLTATTQVVIDRTAEEGHPCFGNYTTTASWADLRRLRDVYGWSVTSQGMHYANPTTFTTDAQRYEESAATLPVFQAHGFPRAWGSFAFANNKQDLASQTMVARYFGFTRSYGQGTNTRESATVFPFKMSTQSVNGGRCNNPRLPCYSMAVTNDRRTTSPVLLSSILDPGPGAWGVVQFYRLVEDQWGSLGDAFAWDCRSPAWQDRWTSQPELYCRNNFLQALDGRNPTAQDTDPTSMAELWGRLPNDFLALGSAPRPR